MGMFFRLSPDLGEVRAVVEEDSGEGPLIVCLKASALGE